MSHSDDETDSTNKSDIFKPYTANGQEILYLDNDATLGGILHEVNKFWKRKNLFQTYLKHGVVPVGSRIATDDLRTVAFLEDHFTDQHGFDNPAGPSTEARIMRYDIATPSKKFAFDITAADAIDRKLYFKGEHYIEQTETNILTSLTHVISKATNRDTLIDEADGVGTDLLKALRELFKKAPPRAKAVVSAVLSNIVSRGITVRLSGESLKDFLTAYKFAKINIDPSERPSDASELSMMNTIAYKSSEIRDLYETKCENSPPTNLAEAVKIIESILTSRKLAEDLDEVNTPKGPKAPRPSRRAWPSSQPSSPSSATRPRRRRRRRRRRTRTRTRTSCRPSSSRPRATPTTTSRTGSPACSHASARRSSPATRLPAATSSATARRTRPSRSRRIRSPPPRAARPTTRASSRSPRA